MQKGKLLGTIEVPEHLKVPVMERRADKQYPHPLDDPFYKQFDDDDLPITEVRTGGSAWAAIKSEGNEGWVWGGVLTPLFLAILIGLMWFGSGYISWDRIPAIGPLLETVVIIAPLFFIGVLIIFGMPVGWWAAREYALSRSYVTTRIWDGGKRFLETEIPASFLEDRADALTDNSYMMLLPREVVYPECAAAKCERPATCEHPPRPIYERDLVHGTGAASARSQTMALTSFNNLKVAENTAGEIAHIAKTNKGLSREQIQLYVVSAVIAGLGILGMLMDENEQSERQQPTQPPDSGEYSGQQGSQEWQQHDDAGGTAGETQEIEEDVEASPTPHDSGVAAEDQEVDGNGQQIRGDP